MGCSSSRVLERITLPAQNYIPVVHIGMVGGWMGWSIGGWVVVYRRRALQFYIMTILVGTHGPHEKKMKQKNEDGHQTTNINMLVRTNN